MAIAPIQLQQTQVNPLQAIMSGAAALSDTLDKAIDAGRDRANNQARLDQQLTQNLQLATGMAERRAQNLDQRLIDTRNFNYRQDQDALQLDLRREALENNRDQQLFNQDLATERLGLAQNADTRAQTSLDLRQQEMARERDFLREIANPTAENTPVPPAVTADGNVVPVTPERTYADLLDQKERADSAVAAATKLRDPSALRTAQRVAAEAEAAIKTTPQPLTEAERRAQEDQEFQRTDRASREAESRYKTMVEGDTTAFVPQQTFLGPEPTDPKQLEEYNKKAALAEAYDKNAYSSELESARNAPEEQYVNNIPNPTPAAIKKRREFWQYANGSAAAPQQSSGVSDAIKKLLGR